MAAYVTLTQIKTALPADLTAQLLDDIGSGMANAAVWTGIAARVESEINGKIGQRYPLPLAEPLPEIITNAAFILAAELIYQRKNFFGDSNPWAKRAEGIRGTLGQQGGQPGLLDRIASGEQPLTATAVKQKPSASAIVETAKTTNTSGNLMC